MQQGHSAHFHDETAKNEGFNSLPRHHKPKRYTELYMLQQLRDFFSPQQTTRDPLTHPLDGRPRHGTTYRYKLVNGERVPVAVRNPGYYIHTLSTGLNRHQRRALKRATRG